jgi:hypothetical protein
VVNATKDAGDAVSNVEELLSLIAALIVIGCVPFLLTYIIWRHVNKQRVSRARPGSGFAVIVKPSDGSDRGADEPNPRGPAGREGED